MLIFLIILCILAAIITAILLSPVYVIIKNDKSNNLIILYKLLFKTFGENPDPNHPIVKALKKSTGIERLEKESLEKNIEDSGLSTTVSETCRILADLLKEIAKLLKYCTAKEYKLKIICSSDDAAETAVSYGKCCAAAFPLLGLFGSLMKIKKKGRNIDIRCDFTGKKELFRYKFVISVKLCHVLAAFLRVAITEAKRRVALENEAEAKEKEKLNQQKTKKQD